ncbi:MAG TPA: hypothetical protein VF746_30475 [Longimicrobium sp.]|jgi:hypothetical protein
MRRRSGAYRPGERYVLQHVGGGERIAQVGRAPGPSGLALFPAGAGEERAEPTLAGGEWLVEPGERLVRDWAGRYWSVTARAADGRDGDGPGPRPPGGCEVVFARFTPAGEAMSYRVASAVWPGELGDAELVRMLRRAWDSLATDRAERLRRLGAGMPEGVEL